ncbi:MAG: DUF2490 domain-containing protein [Chitinophagia bacterium]|jgi:hypothetical protein|nr:DUF2490 domain-containing protein [Chitinophagia bacterium]NCA30388.1 DUF2490 domain-containing protein [Chitinophagia bacterium]NDD16101.1 DUF2490 domain-containing protein [Chitinophagia bacterium]
MSINKRFILLAGLLGVIHLSVMGQSNDLGTWIIYFGNQKINDKWNIQSDFQYRDYRFLSQRNQLLARAGIGYNLKQNNHNILLGYAYIATDIYDQYNISNGTKVENRVYQQYLYKNNIGTNSLTHRFRIEERFFPNEFGLRGRYFISLLKPLSKTNGGGSKTYLSLYNELFVDIKGAQFDRNRIYTGIGFGINESLRVETGYMIQAQKNITRGQLQFILFNNLPFKKQNQKKV